MEEAYRELYQQFLLLRSLCLKQAAMLHQLTTALQKQKDGFDPHGDMTHMCPIPAQFTNDGFAFAFAHPHQLLAEKRDPPSGIDHFPGLLAADMARLRVDTKQKNQNVEPKQTNSIPSESVWCPDMSTSKANPLRSTHPSDKRSVTVPEPPPFSSCLNDDFFKQSDEAMFSEMTLQSHVCEFCHAVFPGEASTRGEFLRHLYTHVT